MMHSHFWPYATIFLLFAVCFSLPPPPSPPLSTVDEHPTYLPFSPDRPVRRQSIPAFQVDVSKLHHVSPGIAHHLHRRSSLVSPSELHHLSPPPLPRTNAIVEDRNATSIDLLDTIPICSTLGVTVNARSPAWQPQRRLHTAPGAFSPTTSLSSFREQRQTFSRPTSPTSFDTPRQMSFPTRSRSTAPAEPRRHFSFTGSPIYDRYKGFRASLEVWSNRKLQGVVTSVPNPRLIRVSGPTASSSGSYWTYAFDLPSNANVDAIVLQLTPTSSETTSPTPPRGSYFRPTEASEVNPARLSTSHLFPVPTLYDEAASTVRAKPFQCLHYVNPIR